MTINAFLSGKPVVDPSLARLAIKLGDKEKCVALLLQCREAIRSRGYVAYDLHEVLGHEDLREVWDQLKPPGVSGGFFL